MSMYNAMKKEPKADIGSKYENADDLSPKFNKPRAIYFKKMCL